MSRNAIPGAVREFLYAVAAFNSESGRDSLEGTQVRGALDELLLGQEAEVRAAGVDPEVYQQARYALVALADDLALHSDWDYAEEWSRDLMEQRYFSTSFSGTEFFDRLHALRQRLAGTHDPGLRDQVLGALEVYYACLRLGFQGRFRRGQAEELQGIVRSTLALLWPEGDQGLRRRLWERAYAQGGSGTLERRNPLWWWPIPVSVAVVVGTWFLCFYDQKGKVDRVARDVHGKVSKSLPGTGEGGGK